MSPCPIASAVEAASTKKARNGSSLTMNPSQKLRLTGLDRLGRGGATANSTRMAITPVVNR